MSTWEERMSAKAKARQVVQEAEEIAQFEAAMPALPGEGPAVTSMAQSQSHLGHRVHSHWSHGIVCSCGQQDRSVVFLGQPCEDDEERCPVCEARGITPG